MALTGRPREFRPGLWQGGYRPFPPDWSMSAWQNTIGPCPGEPVLGLGARPVFGADPAPIAETVEHGENRRIIHFAVVGLVARWHRGDLHMADKGQMPFESPDEIARDDLGVVEIELDTQVGAFDL